MSAAVVISLNVTICPYMKEALDNVSFFFCQSGYMLLNRVLQELQP